MANNTGIKFGGRVQGTPNLLTKEIREILNNVISKELEVLPETLKKIDIEKRLELVIKLLPFVLPKMDKVDLNINQITEPITGIEFVTITCKEELERYDKIKGELERYDKIKNQ